MGKKEKWPPLSNPNPNQRRSSIINWKGGGGGWFNNLKGGLLSKGRNPSLRRKKERPPLSNPKSPLRPSTYSYSPHPFPIPSTLPYNSNPKRPNPSCLSSGDFTPNHHLFFHVLPLPNMSNRMLYQRMKLKMLKKMVRVLQERNNSFLLLRKFWCFLFYSPLVIWNIFILI